jgi:hypothetical protein
MPAGAFAPAAAAAGGDDVLEDDSCCKAQAVVLMLLLFILYQLRRPLQCKLFSLGSCCASCCMLVQSPGLLTTACMCCTFASRCDVRLL